MFLPKRKRANKNKLIMSIFGDDILYSEQEYLNWMFRIVLATLCGCVIGYERTSRNKSAAFEHMRLLH